ncbi:hypothetical protein C8R43DRAFT_996927 [Mycena crocata]|nr:hypothetical protein C8R43DRAFT_996927 [Mycena crocata]
MSPFSHLLSTNSVPSDAEYAAIRQFLSGLEKNFASLVGEISRMQSVVTGLVEQSQQLRESIDSHIAVVSLARRLSEDVVREIFLACLPTEGDAVMSSREAPLLLGQVCSSWRKIAFSTPHLWRSLHIVVPNKARMPQITAAASAWLTRSGVLPISLTLVVSVQCEGRAPGASTCNVETMIGILTDFAPRWKRVKITLSPHTILTPLTNLRPEDVPMLESIELTSVGSGSWHNLVLPLKIPWRRFTFLSSPTIRKASFTSLGGNLLGLALPWPLLTHLHLRSGSLKDSSSYELTTTTARLLLGECPNLTSCIIAITLDEESNDPTSPHPAIPLLHLVEFMVDNREHSPPKALAFFRCLQVPALNRFDYRGPKYDLPQLPFVTMLAGVNALEGLAIDVGGLTAAAYLHCVELLPALTHLRLERADAFDPWAGAGPEWGRTGEPATANDLLRLLTPAPHAEPGQCIAPCLRSLAVLRCEPLADDVVLNFVLARAEAGHPLSRLRVAFTRLPEFDIRRYLTELVAEGLNAELSYQPPPPALVYSPWEGREGSSRA